MGSGWHQEHGMLSLMIRCDHWVLSNAKKSTLCTGVGKLILSC
jgi:hypothetical protein